MSSDPDAVLPDFLKTVYPRGFEEKTRGLNRPFITLTYAQSLDGCVAGPGGESMPLSGKDSLIMTHWMRTLHEGILVGINTLKRDNPRLYPHLLSQHARAPQPVVVDGRLETPHDCMLVKAYSKGQGPGRQPLILTIAPSDTSEVVKMGWESRKGILENAGAKVLIVESINNTRVDLTSAMAALKKEGIQSLMVEGGASIMTSFLSLRDGSRPVVDMHVVTVSPMMVGNGGYNPIAALDKAVVLEPLIGSFFGKDAVIASKLE